MSDADTLIVDALSKAKSEFNVTVQTITELTQPNDMKDALDHFVRGLDHFNQAIKFAEKYDKVGAYATINDNKLKREATEKFATAMVNLLKSAKVCFGKEKRVLF